MENQNPQEDKPVTELKDAQPSERPWFKKKRFIIPIGLLLLAGVGNALGEDENPATIDVVQEQASDESTDSDSVDAEETEETSSEAIDENSEANEEPIEDSQSSNETSAGESNDSSSGSPDQSDSESTPSNIITAGQSNAIDSAESYLRFSSFSRSSLIDQLEFEGFSSADATFAVDTVSPDWFEQAAKSAESYLDFSSFSRQGLIDQLEFEGFTTEEATYGADQVGLSNSGGSGSSGETVSQANAVESAEGYLRFSSFSRTGLIEQLEFEGYSNSDAVYAVNKVNPDWFEQAAKSAQSYLDFTSFSRQGLIDQLKFEGFTTQEATYGADAVGL
jgi:hypothetical protein